MIKLTNIPNGEKISDDFSVMVNGKQAQLYQVRVSDIPLYRTFTGEERPLETTELSYVGRRNKASVNQVMLKKYLQSILHLYCRFSCL